MLGVQIMSFAVRQIVENAIDRLGRFNMPVEFLRFIASSNYSYSRTSGTDNANLVFNTVNFGNDVLRGLGNFRPGGTMGETSAILTFYHEMTHALLDLKEDDEPFRSFIQSGIRHYQNAPMRGGGTSGDESRLFQEAAASYVGHRAAKWYGTYELLEVYRETVSRNTWEGVQPDFFDNIERLATAIPNNYDMEMAERTFGYDQGFLGLSRQIYTTRRISDSIKEFCDREILESRIPDTFQSTYFLNEKYRSLLQLIEDSRHIVPFSVVP